MNYFFKVVFRVLLIGIFLSSCQKDEITPELPDRTVIVYMVSDDILYPYALDNLEQMKEGWASYDGNLVMYTDGPDETPRLMRMKLNSNGKGETEIIKQYEEQNSASSATLQNVLNEAIQRYPAKSYGVILWGHGTGWLPASTYTLSTKAGWMDASLNLPAGFVKTYTSDNSVEMSIQDMAGALPSGLDFVIFDVCFMGGIEVAYELKDKTRYVLASPTEVLGAGMPYNEIIPELFKTEANLQGAAQKYYELYNSQSGLYRSGTIGLIDCAELESLALTMKNIVQGRWETIQQLDLSTIQHLDRLNRHLFYDLGHFVQNISSSAEYAAFEEQLNKTVLYKANTPDFINIPLLNFSGLSSFIPQNQGVQYTRPYAGLSWTKAIGLDTYLP